MQSTHWSTQRKSFRHGDTKRAAVEAALALVVKHGQDAVTLRAVAEGVGVNHRALYRHYASRQDLLFAVAELGFARLADALEEIARTDGENGGVSLARTYADFALAEPHLYDLMFALPLRKCFHEAAGVGPQLRRVVNAAAAAAVQSGSSTPVNGTEIRNRVVHIWGLAHGLIGLYRAGAWKARTDLDAVQFLVESVRLLIPVR